MGPIAHGNDLAGSIRHPAYCTGVYGLRPSLGRVPAFLPSATEERTVGVQTMSVQGPLARTVADLRLALEAMAMPDPRDPWYAPVPLRGPEPARPIRVAMTCSVPGADVHPAVRRAVEQAGEWLAQAGYAVEAVEPPHLAEAPHVWAAIAETEAGLSLHAAIERLGDAGIRRASEGMRRGVPRLDLEGYARAMARRSTLMRDWFVFLERFALVLGPVCAEPPFPWGLDVGTDAEMDRVRRAQGPQFLLPVLGLPGLSAPLGEFDGAPLGVQLVASRYREDRLFDAAEVLESRCPSRTPIDPAWRR
jgi:amidase